MTGAVSVRATVAAGRVIHRSPSPRPFCGGAAIELPPEHAAELRAGGHIVVDAHEATAPQPLLERPHAA